MELSAFTGDARWDVIPHSQPADGTKRVCTDPRRRVFVHAPRPGEHRLTVLCGAVGCSN